jgi:hypothetical protein
MRRTEQQGLDDAEHRGVHADPQRQRGERDERVAGGLQEGAEGEAHKAGVIVQCSLSIVHCSYQDFGIPDRRWTMDIEK